MCIIFPLFCFSFHNISNVKRMIHLRNQYKSTSQILFFLLPVKRKERTYFVPVKHILLSLVTVLLLCHWEEGKESDKRYFNLAKPSLFYSQNTSSSLLPTKRGRKGGKKRQEAFKHHILFLRWYILFSLHATRRKWWEKMFVKATKVTTVYLVKPFPLILLL